MTNDFDHVTTYLDATTPQEVEAVAILIGRTLKEDESLDDVLTGCAYLGARRAKLLNRPGSIDHLVFALAIFTWWPFKPTPPKRVELELRRVRRAAFMGLARLSPVVISERSIAWLVPDETLKLSLHRLYQRQRSGVEEFLRVGEGESYGGSPGIVEYALILILVSFVVLAILLTMGSQVKNVLSNIVGALGG